MRRIVDAPLVVQVVVTISLLFALLAWTALRLTVAPAPPGADLARLRRLTLIGIGLLALQIALGGWTSSNSPSGRPNWTRSLA